MILGQVSYIDCFVFLCFLVPQLLLQAGVWSTLLCGIRALPHIIILIPFHFVKERYFTRRRKQSPFVRQASPFQDFVIRCVRYAFACIPARIGRVFFSKPVALPFMMFRMLRHGFLRCPIYWREIQRDGFKGIWIVPDELVKPDIIVFYCHGGGFSMGSSYFYLEFLIAWVSLLRDQGYRNPGLLALEYTLVPDRSYPFQVDEAMAGYAHALSIVGDASRVCVAGDSAGATLVLSILLRLAEISEKANAPLPGFAVLISPWTTLVSAKNRNTASDYLNADSLHLYARQYAASASLDDPLVSPGRCRDQARWRSAAPSSGLLFLYGSEEVFAPETEDLVSLMTKAGVETIVRKEDGSIHAWPVATLFLSDTKAERQKGLQSIVQVMRRRMV